MSWPRAAVVGVVAVVVTFVLCVEVPNLIVQRMTSVSRSLRADLAAGFFTVALVAILWGLRRGQQLLLDRERRAAGVVGADGRGPRGR